MVSSDRQADQIPKGFLLLAVFGGISLRAHHFQPTVFVIRRSLAVCTNIVSRKSLNHARHVLQFRLPVRSPHLSRRVTADVIQEGVAAHTPANQCGVVQPTCGPSWMTFAPKASPASALSPLN